MNEFATSFPPELAAKRPSPDAFSLTEIVYHLGDVERLWHERFAEMQAKESGVVFAAMNPDEAARQMRYNEKSLAAGLVEWAQLREKTFDIAKAMPEETLRRVALHPRYGEMTTSRMLDIIANHDLQHLDQMKRTLKRIEA